jgi:hypothetical protein
MRPRLALPIILIFVLAACGADTPVDDDGTPPPSSGTGGVPVLVIADGDGDPGAGLSVAQALTHPATDDLVTVSGALFVDPDGTVRLCDAIAESFPPQCGADRLVVEGLDLETIANLQTEGDVSWAEGVSLFGSVE